MLRSPTVLVLAGSILASAALAAPAGAIVLINEVDSNTPAIDELEFVELYDNGAGNTSLNGMVIVFYNGSGDVSYAAFDLDGFSTDANGYFVLGNPSVVGVDMTFPTNFLQNGPDAVALYQANASAFPAGTPVTTSNLLDAVVYDTADLDDPGLLVLTPGQQQVNEDEAGNSDFFSNQRCGGGPRITFCYHQFNPTPAAASPCAPCIVSVPGDLSPNALAFLDSPSPNPSSGSMRIGFGIVRESRVRLSIVDLAGREVAVLAVGVRPPGRHEAWWNGRDGNGEARAGLYFIHLEAGDESIVRRAIRVR